MRHKRAVYMDEEEPSPSGPYDREAGDEDLWFLPGPPDEDDDLPPLPRAPVETAQISDWIHAQADNAVALADTAARLGALGEHLARGPEGWRYRLALNEAAALSHWTGDRLGVDRIGLWLSLRESAVTESAQALTRAGWAVRRLTSGAGPLDDIAEFLGRDDDEVRAFAELLRGAGGLHPIVRAGLAFHLWPKPDAGGQTEAALIAARNAGQTLGQGVQFAPLAGSAAVLSSGPANLARWLSGLDQAALRALRDLERLEAWETLALSATADLSGRTPPRLIRALRDWPQLSAPMATELTGASRAAISRNMSRLADAGLVTEVTGQGRFRVWKARIGNA